MGTPTFFIHHVILNPMNHPPDTCMAISHHQSWPVPRLSARESSRIVPSHVAGGCVGKLPGPSTRTWPVVLGILWGFQWRSLGGSWESHWISWDFIQWDIIYRIWMEYWFIPDFSVTISSSLNGWWNRNIFYTLFLSIAVIWLSWAWENFWDLWL